MSTGIGTRYLMSAVAPPFEDLPLIVANFSSQSSGLVDPGERFLQYVFAQYIYNGFHPSPKRYSNNLSLGTATLIRL